MNTLRQEAIKRTNELMANINEQKASEIMKQDFSKVTEYVWNSGVGSWYYDDECTKFCTDVLRFHIIEQAIKWYDIQAQLNESLKEGWGIFATGKKDTPFELQRDDSMRIFATDDEVALYVFKRALTEGGIYSKALNFLSKFSNREYQRIVLLNTSNELLEVAVEVAWQRERNSSVPNAEERWSVIQIAKDCVLAMNVNEETEDIDEVAHSFLNGDIRLKLSNGDIVFEGDSYFVIENSSNKKMIVQTILDSNSDLSKVGYKDAHSALMSLEFREYLEPKLDLWYKSMPFECLDLIHGTDLISLTNEDDIQDMLDDNSYKWHSMGYNSKYQCYLEFGARYSDFEDGDGVNIIICNL